MSLSMTRSLVLLATCSLLSVTTAAHVAPDYAPQDGQSYDYIVVGGGLSGLVVANRLTELTNGTSDNASDGAFYER